MSAPKNVIRFEVLLYLSLTLDALSVAVQDHTPSAISPWQTIMMNALMAACLILLQVYFVWLAARRRKSWPRLALLAALVLTVISLVPEIGQRGVTLDSFIEIVSCAMTAVGLYLSFTPEAGSWFSD